MEYKYLYYYYYKKRKRSLPCFQRYCGFIPFRYNLFRFWCQRCEFVWRLRHDSRKHGRRFVKLQQYIII